VPQKGLDVWTLSTALTTTHHQSQRQLYLDISQSNSFILEIPFKLLLENTMKSSPISSLPILKLLPDGFIFVFEINQNNYVK